MNENKISIIVPVYNIEEYIAECVESLVHQTYKNIEIILVDDGSTDKSGKICDKYAEADGRIVVIHKANGGLVSARKAGLERATGEYVMNVDGDDYISLLACEEMMKAMLENDVDVVQSGYMRFNETGETSCKTNWFYGKREVDDEVRKELLEAWMKEHDPDGFRSQAWAKLYKKRVIEESYMLIADDMSYGEDFAFFVYVLKVMKSFYVLKQSLYFYRIRSQSLAHGLDAEQFLHKEDKLINYLLNAINTLFTDFSKDALREWLLARKFRALRVAYKTVGVELEKKASKSLDKNAEAIDETQVQEHLKSEIEKYDKIYIYGAGIVGKRLCRWMFHNNMKQDIAFTVTNGNGQKDILGRPVVEVKSLLGKSENAVIIVAVGAELEAELRKVLEALGISNYFALDDDIRNLLRKMEGSYE